MSVAYRLLCPHQELSGNINLEPSKSISNRVLILQSLCKEDFQINRLSTSDDTVALRKMLSSSDDILYAGHAGSSYRFMVARACLGDKEVKLDGSGQLQKRQIGPLVKALQTLGADIKYVNREGYPPLMIRPTGDLGSKTNEVSLQAGVSSQYVSALLMIAPYLPNGLILHLQDDPVSIPYIRMTLEIMQWFGIEHTWVGNTISVSKGQYVPKEFTVESDWSAASYYYSMAALAQKAEIHLEGLSVKSLQGDAIVREIFEHFGVTTTTTEKGILLTKMEQPSRPKEMRLDFTPYPDLAQTVMVTLAAFGIKGILTGLKTLRIKETDRLAAMQEELAKVKVLLALSEEKGNISVVLNGKAKWKDKAKFNTYDDHRMAMAFTSLACIHPIIIRNPEVVSKSYPGFWKDIQTIGIKIEKVRN